MSAPATEALIEAVAVPVLLIGPDQRILGANSAAAALFGAGLVGRPAPAVMRHPDFLEGLERCLAAGAPVALRLTLSAGGAEMRLAVSFRPLAGDAAGRLLCTIEDLTAAEQALAARRDFLANVSHELRTPLTALAGFIDTLQGAARDDPAARARFLAIMERETSRMSRLVDDLLSLSRVEAEERRRPAAQVELLGLLRATLATHRDAARAAGVALTLEGEEGPLTLRGDADQLMQVFHNLVENALKYGSSGGSVTVRVDPPARDPVLKAEAVRVEVIDRGEGIDPLHLPRLTERFYRVDTHRSRARGGTGLGLAIVKHIVNRHRGRLKIESEPGRGSRFAVILPLG